MSSLADRVVVVAGGTGALGGAVVEEMRARGARVHVGERRPPAGERPLDALDESSVQAFFEALAPKPWALVNVIGGWAPGAPVAETDLAALRKQLDQNLVTAMLLTKWAVRTILAAGAGGRIVHVASRAALENGANAFAYSVSKLGVTRLVEAAAAENRDAGITVNCVLPSTIDTPANRAAMPKADASRWTKPAEIARVIAFLVSDDAAIVSGAAIPVYGRS